MTSDNPVDYPLLTPAMRDVVRGMARVRRPALEVLTPAQARAAYEAGADVLEIPAEPLHRVEDFTIAARDGAELPARCYVPDSAQPDGTFAAPGVAVPAPAQQPWPVLLYLHGGGFTVGSVRTHDRLCRTLARQAGCMVVSLDYRLAPEHPFPTAHNDAWDALHWLHRHAHTLGGDAGRMAVGGDSAGGTLAAACALQARDAGLPLALQLLVYPGTTAWQDTDSHRRFAAGPVLMAQHIQWFFRHYARQPGDREDWRFAPLLAPDVAGVAPAFFCLAEVDPLVDEGILYADMLRMAGVAVSLEIYRGVTHEFVKMGRVIPEARRAHADMAAALRAAFTGHGA